MILLNQINSIYFKGLTLYWWKLSEFQLFTEINPHPSSFWPEQTAFDVQLKGSIAWKGLGILKVPSISCYHSLYNGGLKLSKDWAYKAAIPTWIGKIHILLFYYCFCLSIRIAAGA